MHNSDIRINILEKQKNYVSYGITYIDFVNTTDHQLLFEQTIKKLFRLDDRILLIGIDRNTQLELDNHRLNENIANELIQKSDNYKLLSHGNLLLVMTFSKDDEEKIREACSYYRYVLFAKIKDDIGSNELIKEANRFTFRFILSINRWKKYIECCIETDAEHSAYSLFIDEKFDIKELGIGS